MSCWMVARLLRHAYSLNTPRKWEFFLYLHLCRISPLEREASRFPSPASSEIGETQESKAPTGCTIATKLLEEVDSLASTDRL